MVAAQQSRIRIPFGRQSLVGLSIAYDGRERVASVAHEQAVEVAYKNGYDDASSQFNQQILEFRSEIKALSEGTFARLDDKFQVIVREARDALMTLTYDCVARALGGFEMTAEAIKSIVEAIVVESGLDDERMEVRLNAADLSLLEQVDAELKAKHAGLLFVTDNSLGRGDCILSSRFGKIDGLMSTKLEKLKGNLRPS